jgi:hypothetical protein
MSTELSSARENRPVNKRNHLTFTTPLELEHDVTLYKLYKDISIYFLPLLNLYQWSLCSSYFSTQPRLVQPDPIWTRSLNIPSPSSTARILTGTALLFFDRSHLNLVCAQIIVSPNWRAHSHFTFRRIQIVAIRSSGDFA